MIFKLIKINRFLVPKWAIAYNIRWKGFIHCENERLDHSRKFCREVLRKTEGSILFESAHRFDPSAGFIKNDECILKLIELENSEKSKNKANNQWIRDKLFPSLDMECLQRSENWSIEQKLFVLDIWDHKLYAMGRFNSIFYNRMPRVHLKCLEELPKGPTLQILYYLTRSKQQLQEDEEKYIFQKLHNNLNGLTLEEASLFYAVLVLCKCQPRIEVIYSSLIRRILTQLTKKLDLTKEPPIAVSYAVKAVRRLCCDHHNRGIEALQSKLIPVAKQADHYLLTHIAQLGVRQNVFNPMLLTTVIERLMDFLNSESQVLRLKDVQRSLLLIATFRFIEYPDIVAQYCAQVQQHLKQSLQTKFPVSLIQCVAHLATMGTVDHELVDWALKCGERRAEFILAADLEELLVIDSFAKINLYNAYNGHILPDRICAELKSKLKSEKPTGFHHNAQKNIVDIFKMNNHHVLHTEAAPHFNSPDFLFVYDTLKQITVEIPDSGKCGKILRASDLHAKKTYLVPVALVIYTQKSLVYNKKKRKIATGPFRMKLKQLELLGFRVVPWYIRSDEWESISEHEKLNRLHKRLCMENINLFYCHTKL